MDPNPYAASDITESRSSGVSFLEWAIVVLIGAFTIASAIACWHWLREFP